MSEDQTTLVDLRMELDWNPRRLVIKAFRWPIPWPSLRLGEIGFRIDPQLFVEEGPQVIVPDGLDRVYGGVRRRTTQYQGAGYLVGGEPGNLHVGDVLVPARTDLPALMVHSGLSGSIVSGGFSAFRFRDTWDAYWTWALLNSISGRRFRRAFLIDSLSARRNRIDDAPLPWPDNEKLVRLSSQLTAVETESRDHEEDAVATWWSTADLRRVDWKMATSMPEPESLRDGVPLTDLALGVDRGKPFDRGLALAAPADGTLPVVTGGSLAGRPITRWMTETPGLSTADVGDIVFAVVGKRANARVVKERALIDSGVYRVRLADSRFNAAVVGFLNGQEGYGLRNVLLSGSIIPRINLRDLSWIRIPESLLCGDTPSGPLEPLAERLERLLWVN